MQPIEKFLSAAASALFPHVILIEVAVVLDLITQTPSTLVSLADSWFSQHMGLAEKFATKEHLPVPSLVGVLNLVPL